MWAHSDLDDIQTIEGVLCYECYEILSPQSLQKQTRESHLSINVKSLGRQSKLTKFREQLNSFIERFKKMNPASEYAYFIINTQ